MFDFGIGFVLKKTKKSAEVSVLKAVNEWRASSFQDTLAGSRLVDIKARRQRQLYLSALRKIVEEGAENDLKLASRIWRGGCR